jgi:hypothetical protein
MDEQSSEINHIEVDNSSTLQLRVDPEPVAMRLTLVGILIISVVIGYLALSEIFGLGACSLLSIFGALIIGAGVLQLSERLIKPRWKSNRFVKLSDEALYIQKGDEQRQVIDPREDVNVHMWCFEIRRRSRVPKGWYVVATALEQDDVYLPVYTLASPDSLSKMRFSSHFTQLEPQQGGGPRVNRQDRDLRLSGQQRRLLMAEGARDMEGVEMVVEDFEAYLNWLQARFPQWMPSP